MTKQIINVGLEPNDKNGDSIRVAMIKINENFQELYQSDRAFEKIIVSNNSYDGNTTIYPANVTFGNSSVYSQINSTTLAANSIRVSYVLNKNETDLSISTFDEQSLSIGTNNNVRMFVSPNGNIGVANNIPDDLFRVEGNLGAVQIAVGNVSSNATINSTFFSATANNTSFVGSVTAANVVSNNQLQGNLANYLALSGVTANVLVRTANNTNFVGEVSAANVVSNAQLQANLSAYLTLAGVTSNVLVRTANNTNFVGSVTAANVVSNAQLQSNLALYVSLAGLAGNVAKLTANNSLFLGGTAAASFVQNTDSRTLSGNLYFTGANTTFENCVKINANCFNIGAQTFVMGANGKVGINYPGPDEQLCVGGNLKITGDFYIGGEAIFDSLRITGNACVNGYMSFNSGYGSCAVVYGCRAWVKFSGMSGSVTIIEDGNISSVTEIERGKYRVNFTTPLVDSNYSCVGNATIDRSTWPGGQYPLAGTVEFTAYARTYVELQVIGGSVVGNQLIQNKYDGEVVTLAFFR